MERSESRIKCDGRNLVEATKRMIELKVHRANPAWLPQIIKTSLDNLKPHRFAVPWLKGLLEPFMPNVLSKSWSECSCAAVLFEHSKTNSFELLFALTSPTWQKFLIRTFSLCSTESRLRGISERKNILFMAFYSLKSFACDKENKSNKGEMRIASLRGASSLIYPRQQQPRTRRLRNRAHAIISRKAAMDEN